MRKAKFIFYVIALVAMSPSIKAQVTGGGVTPTGQSLEEQRNVITTAMPFLLISPDSRSAGMGDVGVALSPDANAMQWNAARLAFVKNEIGASLSYSPWLTKIGVNDMSISYLSGYYRISQEQVIGIDMKYFDLGSIFFTDTGQPGDGLEASPKDFSFAVAYSRKLSDNFSASLTARVARSNLFGDYQGSNLEDPKPATALGVDLGVFYTKSVLFNGNDSEFSSGLQISNISNKITYSDDDNEQFLPINLRIGTAFTTAIDPYNNITLSVDFNKLMVPTPNEDDTVRVTLLEGMFGSFGDAPGGYQEELREISIASGLEYWYNEIFAVRTGYFYEHVTKGGRQYFTAGLGFRYQVLGLDFSYLIPTKQQNPLAETLRFTATFSLENLNSENRTSITE
ncbi:type IX secretion system outer membrane channel protein PorV [Marivirga sp. S37H4]|uniref:Type IX secretion system outer membrane channel protein PorV n=1 Tax=Marivirga aurantiaca TaxID=2802615 RepID=A0A935CBK4_9BACT|nr:type IX secretion system outer membrane channel protein PorV [Marivirga aurantiaca]MBK6267371.1 type IX secretion system outer membrane channel protein PorV [Marivirga aurantiaca]